MTSPASGPAVVDAVARIDGWLTDAQIAALATAAAGVPSGGRIVEIGSFRGRSTVVLGLSARTDVEIVAIDPHAGNDRGPQEIEGFAAAAADDHRIFLENLAAAGVADRIRHVRTFSSEAHDAVDDPIDLLFVDGAHRVGPARADLRDWGGRVREGGTLLVHDSFSSIGVTAAIATELLMAAEWRYTGRAGSLAAYRRVARSEPGRVGSALRQLGALPWFARNVAVKVLLVARLGRVARLLGHDGTTWPY